MDVQLQVVGIFYNVNVTIPDSGQTVKDVMDAAHNNPGGNAGSLNGAGTFAYATHIDSPGATPTMSAIGAIYNNPFQSRVLGNHYPAGVYSLTESFDPNQSKNLYSVWQYYLFDANGTFIPGNPAEQSFVTRSMDGVSKVTWRLVSILGGPGAHIGELESLSARNPAKRLAPKA